MNERGSNDLCRGSRTSKTSGPTPCTHRFPGTTGPTHTSVRRTFCVASHRPSKGVGEGVGEDGAHLKLCLAGDQVRHDLASTAVAIAAGVPPADIWHRGQRAHSTGGAGGAPVDWRKDDSSRISLLSTVLIAGGGKPEAVRDATHRQKVRNPNQESVLSPASRFGQIGSTAKAMVYSTFPGRR